MRLTKEEFEGLKPLRECVVEIGSLQSNKVFIGGVEIEIITDISSVSDDVSYLEEKRNKIAKKLVSIQRESPEKISLRKEYIRLKEEIKSEKEAKRVMGEDASMNANRNATRNGILIKKPVYEGLCEGDMFSCDLDCNDGDTVYWDGYWTCQEIAKRRGDEGAADVLIEVEDKLYLRIPKTSLVCKRSGDNFLGLNGYVIGEKIDEEYKSINGVFVKHDSPVQKVRVVSAPKSLPKYRDKEIFRNTKVSEGNIVQIGKQYANPIDKTYSSDTKYVRFLNSMILCIDKN